MTLRVLILGTSHCAALRAAAGADRHSDALTWRGMTLRFAAIPNDHAAAMRLQDGVLTAAGDTACRLLRRINGQDRFDLADVDAVAIAGGLMNSFAVARLYADARWFPLPSLVADGGVPPPGLPLISEAAAMAVLCGGVAEAPLYPVLCCLQGRPVFVLQDPRVSQDATTGGKKMARFRRIAESPDAADLSYHYDRAATGALGALARIILQPAATRAGGFFTDPRFRRGATRLGATADTPQPPDDMLHGNADFGAVVLDDLARAMAV